MKANIKICIPIFLGLSFQIFACSSDQSQKKVAPHSSSEIEKAVSVDFNEKNARDFYTALKRLPAKQYTTFGQFLSDVQKNFSKDESLFIKEISRHWTAANDSPAIFKPDAMWTRSLLLARFARFSSKKEAFEFLGKLVSRKTTNARDVKIPGRGAAFDLLEQDLKTHALKNKLLFSEVEHVAYEITTAKGDNEHKGVAVIAHSDVVPADPSKWNTPPFIMTLKDNKYFGRGILDDKAAISAVMQAMIVLKRSGLKLKADPLFVVGTSEESHWHGIDRYNEARKLPKNVFVTDADFPVGIGEKGVMTLRIKNIQTKQKAITSSKTFEVLEFNGGVVSNQVPAEAYLLLKGQKKSIKKLYKQIVASIGQDFSKDVYRVEILNKNQLRISIKGKAAHAATPDKGINAIAKLMKLIVHTEGLQKIHNKNQCLQLAHLVDNLMNSSNSAEKLGFPRGSDKFSPPTVNMGTLRQLSPNQCEVALNFRWPPPHLSAAVKALASQLIRDEAKTLGFEVEIAGGGLEPFYIEPSSPLVQKLLKSYELVTGKKAEPITVSGTTYAKAAPGSVTFGPASIDDEGGRIHAANEYITEDEFLDLIEIYTLAIGQFSL